MKSSQNAKSGSWTIAPCGSAALFVAVAAVLSALIVPKNADAAPTRSTTIALTSDEQRVVGTFATTGDFP